MELGISLLINGEEFIFDKIGFKLYEEEFKTNSFEIVIDEEGYLARRNLYHIEWLPQHFHRWLKYKRTRIKNPEKEGIHIHHRNGNIKDNRIKNLMFVDAFEHHRLHKIKKAYKTFCEKYYADNPDAEPSWCNASWRRFKEWNDIE